MKKEKFMKTGEKVVRLAACGLIDAMAGYGAGTLIVNAQSTITKIVALGIFGVTIAASGLISSKIVESVQDQYYIRVFPYQVPIKKSEESVTK